MKLNDKLEIHFRINESQKKALIKLGLFNIKDILYFFPTRYTDISDIRHINTLQDGENVTILGEISNLKTKKSFKSKIPMGEATITDITGKIHIIWFHQPYLARMLTEGALVKVTGKVTNNATYGLTLTNPEISKEDILPIDLSDSLFTNNKNAEQYGYPVYPESKGVTSKWIYHTICKILKDVCVQEIIDYLPSDILKKYHLPELRTALIWIHMPQKKDHADSARKRFAFEEVFFIQLARLQERKAYEELFSYKLQIPHKDIDDFISRFPFTPTASQNNAINSILSDFQKNVAMSRLVEGDVGSGKTFVAATVAYAVIKNRPVGQTFGNIQVAYMAPTEVLATQLFENFISYFRHTGINIALITGSGCRKFPSKVASARDDWTNISKNQLLKWIKNGEIPIVIGTHALISKSVEFEDLGLVIIDEQHRFGTNQRMKLAKKEGHAPHYLSMTATPIPRTLALTIYGDLDLSIINEMPAGRKKVITEIVPPNKRDEAYEKIRKELAEGRQAYVICPRINEPDPDQERALQMKNVTSEAKRLQKDIFPEYKIGIMHSKMTKQKKEEVMEEFANHEIDILVSTSVIEVGVNVPNATSIIIEGAERFGLAQLHQLRGRVIRSNHQSYCYLFAEAKTEKTMDRLQALTKAANGFELAELDLTLRGAGQMSGDKQWGISDLGMEAIKNIKLVEAARNTAKEIIEDDPHLNALPHLAQALKEKNLKDLHFE
ncbi:MAG: ATP-dependent helicase RecG [Patescibacteria group bacterium]|jgi:ATP-dependent DNA helicase RecG|nr:ATP-dependent helicase RecG [Patescibacteria group bacterium]